MMAINIILIIIIMYISLDVDGYLYVPSITVETWVSQAFVLILSCYIVTLYMERQYP